MHEVVSRCIHGVDINEMAAEMAKVSLWLESVRPGRPLPFLDATIRVGNSLLGPTPALIAGGAPKEAFAPLEGDDKESAKIAAKFSAQTGAGGQLDMFADHALPLPNAAPGRRHQRPGHRLARAAGRHRGAAQTAARDRRRPAGRQTGCRRLVRHFLRASKRYPLTGRGDINTYAVFAETSRTIIAPRGRVGLVLPTGIATDATTQYFFKDLVTTRTLASVYDFENEDKLVPAVHHSFRFAPALPLHHRPAPRPRRPATPETHAVTHPDRLCHNSSLVNRW